VGADVAKTLRALAKKRLRNQSVGSIRSLGAGEEDEDEDQREEELENATDALLDDADQLLSAPTTRHGGGKEVARRVSQEKGAALRPQDAWRVKPDNSTKPFVHLSSVSDLNDELQTSKLDKREASLMERALRLGRSKATSECHPLGNRIKNIKYEEWMLRCEQAEIFQSFRNTDFTYIDTAGELGRLASKLEAERVVAIDLENHSLHSYQGFLCLMQVSTRREDFIVDCLALREEIGPVLGPMFANEKIVKVMHGARSDIVWLQRDHGIYLANLFDTGHAARVLALPSFGLAYLLQHFCNYNTNKRYQMADWRVRPLPDHLVEYARADTHFLLYIYDRLKIDLNTRSSVPEHLKLELKPGFPQGPVGTVLAHSNRTCLQLYEKPVFTETTYLDYYAKQKDATFTSRQLAVFAGLYAWRDARARELDESPEAVLAKRQLMDLARGSESQSQVATLVAKVCNRKMNVAKSCMKELCLVIESSVEQVISYGSPMKKKTSSEENKTEEAVAPKAATHILFKEDSKRGEEAQDPAIHQFPSEIIVDVSEESRVFETFSQGHQRKHHQQQTSSQKVNAILSSFELPFMKRKKKKSAQEPLQVKEKPEEEDGAQAVKQPSSTDEIRAWADKQIENQNSEDVLENKEEKQASKETSSKDRLPQSLSKKYNLAKSRNQRPAKLDKVSMAKPSTSAFDYSSAREKLKTRKVDRKRQESFAQSFFAIPDEHLVKPAKRRKQPTTGNRSITYKNNKK
jgi:exosome complex exonuclease RRP6